MGQPKETNQEIVESKFDEIMRIALEIKKISQPLPA